MENSQDENASFIFLIEREIAVHAETANTLPLANDLDLFVECSHARLTQVRFGFVSDLGYNFPRRSNVLTLNRDEK